MEEKRKDRENIYKKGRKKKVVRFKVREEARGLLKERNGDATIENKWWEQRRVEGAGPEVHEGNEWEGRRGIGTKEEGGKKERKEYLKECKMKRKNKEFEWGIKKCEGKGGAKGRVRRAKN
jgi:hypothetical protein